MGKCLCAFKLQAVKFHFLKIQACWHLTVPIFSILASSSAFRFEVWPVGSGCWPDWSRATGVITMDVVGGVNESLGNEICSEKWNRKGGSSIWCIWFKGGSSIWLSQNKWCLFLSTCTSVSWAIHGNFHVLNPKWRVCKKDWTANCFLSVSTMFTNREIVEKLFPEYQPFVPCSHGNTAWKRLRPDFIQHGCLT